MTLPAALREGLRLRFGALGEVRAVHAGPSGRAHRVETARAGVLFLKHRDAAPPGLFAAEAAGLETLAATLRGALVVPAVAGHAEAGDGTPAWLALEWLEAGGAPDAAAQERLGRGLAALHQPRPGSWGWPADSFIGGLTQDNRSTPGWAEFWVERRLRPQLRLAGERGRAPGRPDAWERLFHRLSGWLADAGGVPSLLHGDLWAGNAPWTARGPALVDPALYAGHREADLAMMELFGGFPARVLQAYREAYPVDEGYSSLRRKVYQLYYLLVHVNLFGGAYLEQTARLLHECLTD